MGAKGPTFFRFVLLTVLTTGITLLLIINMQSLDLQKAAALHARKSYNSDIKTCNYSSVNIDKKQEHKEERKRQEKQEHKEEKVFKPPFDCEDKKMIRRIDERGKFYVLYNYVVAEKQFKCYESVTYTTQGDFTFLDNLVPLTERWRGPISVSLYAPGDDFRSSLESIAYLRNCATNLIKEFVTFHLFFDKKFIPKNFTAPLFDLDYMYSDDYNCTISPPFLKLNSDIFKSVKNLTYPINVARNTARLAAQTRYIFASDMELLPTFNFIPKFLEMIEREKEKLANIPRKVFVLPIFEVEKNATVPHSKTELLEMLNNSMAFLFHQKLCRKCHEVQNYTEWLEKPEDNDLNVLAYGKRTEKYRHLEAFYVGTNEEPLFDERLSWEGQKNKMTQAYAMCLLDYFYLILDNAFLVHKPGIKKAKVQMIKYNDLVNEMTKLVKKVINMELRTLYGKRKECG